MIQDNFSLSGITCHENRHRNEIQEHKFSCIAVTSEEGPEIVRTPWVKTNHSVTVRVGVPDWLVLLSVVFKSGISKVFYFIYSWDSLYITYSPSKSKKQNTLSLEYHMWQLINLRFFQGRGNINKTYIFQWEKHYIVMFIEHVLIFIIEKQITLFKHWSSLEKILK